MSPVSGGSAVNVAAVSGSAHGGQQPVALANVYLYATSSAGYGGTPTLLGSTTTDGNGNFKFGTLATCPAGQQAYVIVAGGNPGLAAGTNSPAILLMAALGNCASISGFYVNVNEVTTVAAAYTLAGFLPAGGAGMTTTTLGATGAPGVTTSGSNVQGLSDAFLNAANIVDYTGGLPRSAPLANSAGTVPSATIISLANILAACVNTSGTTTVTVNGTTSNTACGNLYAAATPPTGSGIAAPVNVLQAALDIAAYPGNNVTTLFNQSSSFAAFSGGLATAPNDWTLGVSYPSTNLVAPTGLTIDDNDTVYTVGYPTAPAASIAVLQFSPQGGLLSPAAGWNSTASGGTALKSSDNIRAITMDNGGNLYFSDGNIASIYQYAPAGTATAPTAGTFTALSYAAVDATKNSWGIAADANGSVWLTTYSQSKCASNPCNYVEFPVGAFTAPTITIGTGAVKTATASGARAVAADSSSTAGKGNIWATSNNDNTATIVNSSTGAATTVTVSATYPCAWAYGVALDASGNGYIAGAGNTVTGTSATCSTTAPSQLYKISPTGTVLSTIGTGTTVAAGGSTNGTPFSTAFYDVVDGAGNVFVTNSTASTIAEYSPSFNAAAGALLSNNLGFAPGATYNAATTGTTPTAATVSGGLVNTARSIAVDRSGSMWVLNPTTAGALVQIFGVAAPSEPVLSKGGYGVKP